MPVTLSKNADPILGYTLIERLGAGGFGEVWKAEAPGGLLKAVKFVYGEIADRHACQEIKALERIKQVRHPFVLSIERVEIVNRQLVIVSELADRTLLDRFEESRAATGTGIPRKELLRHMQDAAEALDFISANFRLQHLDVKPSNLFLVGGRLKVGDFGLVREVTRHTGTSTPGLSPAYAAPESFTGDVSFYSDQYALAIVYQEMLTGQRPFRGRTSPQLLEQHLHGKPNVAALPEGDQPVIMRSLSKDPKDRFPTCIDMVQALASAVTVEPANQTAAADVVAQAAPAVPAEPAGGLASLAGDRAGMSGCSLPTLHTDLVVDPDGSVISGGSEFTSSQLREDLPLPTLFVGVGGIAGTVLRQVRQLFSTRLDDGLAGRRLAWLLLDTDRHATIEATRSGGGGQFAPEETLLMPLFGPDHYHPRLKQLTGWLGRHWVFRIPRSRCTEGIRPLGRLAFIDNADLVLARLKQSLKRVQQLCRESGSDRFQVVVVSSIGGGTGGGCIADVGVLLRRFLRDEGLGATPVHALLVGGASIRQEQNELARANAYVALKELDHFLSVGAMPAGEDGLDVEAADPRESEFPFASATLVDLGDIVGEEDVQTGARLLAEYLYLARGTRYGLLTHESAGAESPDECRPRVRSFRLARFGFPRAELRRMVAGEVCRRVLGSWLEGPQQPERDPTSSSLHGTDPTTTVLLAAPDEAARLFSGMELDEEKFLDLFLERAERVTGADVLKICQHQIRAVREARNRGAAERALARFFEECDLQFGRGPADSSAEPIVAPFERRLQGEFKSDVTDRLINLETRVREIVEHPGHRLKSADELLSHFNTLLAGQLDEVPAGLERIRERKSQIRQRLVGDEPGPRVAGLLKQLQRDAGPAGEELPRYVQLCIREIAWRIRADLLRALRDKAGVLTHELGRLRRSLEGMRDLFQGGEPWFRGSERVGLGMSTEVLPMERKQLLEFRNALASSFGSEWRLSHLESRFQSEVLAPHGGLRAVLTREPRFVTEVFANALFPRVADAIGVWLEDRDAASLLRQRYGSNEGVLDELVRCLKSPPLRGPEGTSRRIVVCTPNSPSGRSLREDLVGSGSPFKTAAFVSIPEDVVVCLELDGLSLASAAADLVKDQPWLAELAAKLVTRKDVPWANLVQAE